MSEDVAVLLTMAEAARLCRVSMPTWERLSRRNETPHAVLIGRQDDAVVSAGELARLCGTIPYETATALSSRVPRVGVNS